ncbi:putative polyketide synthase [Thozetella sp. PMI_491]|nr:putative polyketide synthase [Thozetella sp. PMI_491]
MVDRIARARQINSVLLFGSQALSPSDAVLDSLRTRVLSSDDNVWILNVIDGLPEWLAKLKDIPGSFRVTAEKLLVELTVWLKTSRALGTPSSSFNIVVTPLTVIHQLLQYVAYLETAYPAVDPDRRFGMLRHSAETVGFCTGLLSAYAVSCASDRQSFEKYGASAIRLAMLCGLVVDAQNYSLEGDQAVSLAAVWHSPEAQQQMTEALKKFPEAYTSVHYDENRVTLTLPVRCMAELQQQLKVAGVTTTEVGLHGRFHWLGHKEATEDVLLMADTYSEFQFLGPKSLVLPTHSNSDRDSAAPLHRDIVRSILLEPPQWHQTIRRVQGSALHDSRSVLVSFGLDRYVPPSLLRKLAPQVVNMTELERQSAGAGAVGTRLYADTDIAIVGMSCKVAGADDVNDFWRILCEGKSQHREVPSDRFTFSSAYRTADAGRKWFGNFMNDHDAFDHKFFKKTPREVASMDPQQRQVLQVAYQAVEQSGYFRRAQPDTKVGCYIGVCAVDYENNIACHPANAFSATGTLRGFIAGKISHFFGWTGPGLTLDSACSSSAVSVHLACQAILNGECSAAIAGGTHVMTSPLCYQNLAGASFLSKTGQCKPFDAKADGYCRGEGCATVFLKKLSTAISEGDQILGVIPSTAVQQNENCTPIVVPNVPSLTDLFNTTIKKSQLRPEQIGVVEAHGTGTAVGDPAEYDSIRQVLGGHVTGRTSQLILSSVKGLIGHLECTSGIVSLIKTVLMIRNGTVPPQASFTTLNPAVKAEVSDRITIPTNLTPWAQGFRAALINNYGASGSNASMVVIEPPSRGRLPVSLAAAEEKGVAVKRPFWICGLDDESLSAYAGALGHFVRGEATVSVMDLSFNLARQSNRKLPRRQLFACRSIAELQEQLSALERACPLQPSSSRPTHSPPVVLCFGGQISKFVGLDRSVYETVAILRQHLDQCDEICRSLGIDSIFPHIFQREPIDDISHLQTALFALQYSSARCWIDSGVQPVAVIGHSFGELSAMCVAGVLSLTQALGMVAARARAIRDGWGPDKGAMMAVEANLGDVERLVELSNASLSKAQEPVVIACFNGPRSFTLAGSTAAIDAAANLVASDASFSVKSKRLAVTNAFHSTLVEPLMRSLRDLAADLAFERPTMEWARCTKTAPEADISADFFAEHLRQPVYFNHCVQRLAARWPQCVWLEAGSNSTVTSMISRALGAPQHNSFLAVNITSDAACDNLTDAAVNLWNAGVDVTYWAHADMQTSEYPVQLLPPYQFARSKHWIDLKEGPPRPVEAAAKVAAALEPEKMPDTLLTFVGYQDEAAKHQRHARFRVNTMIPQFKKLMTGHTIAQTAPICPATVQMDLVVDGLSQLLSLGPDFNPEMYDIENHTPICMDPSLYVWLDLEASESRPGEWLFKLASASGLGSRAPVTHTSGRIVPSAKGLSTELDISRYQRIVSHDRCLELLNCSDPDDVIQGRNIYKTFAEVVDYDEQYRGVVKLVGRGNMSAGTVAKAYDSKTWFDAHLSDTFCQVGGIAVNCMTDRPVSEIYVCRGLERWMRSAALLGDRPPTYDVLANRSSAAAGGPFMIDVFVFHPDTGALVEVVLGLNFVQVNKASIAKLLVRLTNPSATQAALSKGVAAARSEATTVLRTPAAPAYKVPVRKTPQPKRPQARQEDDLLPSLRAIVSELSSIEEDKITLESNLADLGIDSLMGMELVSELEGKFKCSFSLDEAAEVTNMKELVQCVRRTIGATDTGSSSEGKEDELEEDSSESSLDFDGSTPKTSSDSITSAEDSASVPATSGTEIDMVGLLAEFIGIKCHELSPGAVLADFGVDSLMAMEIRAALASDHGVELDEHLVVESMTAADLAGLVNGSRSGGLKPSTAPLADPPTPRVGAVVSQPSAPAPPADHLRLSLATIVDAFNEVKTQTDQYIADGGCANYTTDVLPKQDELCVALALEAFEQLGCSIKGAMSGEKVRLFEPVPAHKQLMRYLCEILERESGLLELGHGYVTRTEKAYSVRPSKAILQELQNTAPQEASANNMTYYAGMHLADVLVGKTDGIKVVFGSPKGRDLVSRVYGDWPLNRIYYRQMEAFLSALIKRLQIDTEGPLKILEMGAGTGGTTKWLLPLLASLGKPVEYTFTDLAPSFVAAARKRFHGYPFVKFRTHDIEKEPAADLLGTQHMVIASNAVHATRSMITSAANIRKALQPNGVLLMLEMTGTLYWVDMIFGLFEGWWLFEDGRHHAVATETQWRQALRTAGFGFTDWTDGSRPENKLERLLIGVSCEEPQVSLPPALASRQAAVDEYVNQMSRDLQAPPPPSATKEFAPRRGCSVLVTGGTGSLGSHLVASLAERADVDSVIVLNRRSDTDHTQRQLQALTSRGLVLSTAALQKLQVHGTDLSKPGLGLPPDTYAAIAAATTHIVHAAWAMSAKRPIQGFVSQFDIMRNMLQLAWDAARELAPARKVHFQFVSSIAVVGHYPLRSGTPHVPEERVEIADVLPNGYGDAKYACERALDETLHRHPGRFAASCVRIGQIAGSTTSGYWNPQEHLPFLLKSAQTLKCLPRLDGLLSWTPVERVAGTLADLVLRADPYPIYHIDNPVRQQWTDMLPVLGRALGLPLSAGVAPFRDWVQRVRTAPGGLGTDNPAAVLVDFLEDNFERM